MTKKNETLPYAEFGRRVTNKFRDVASVSRFFNQVVDVSFSSGEQWLFRSGAWICTKGPTP